MYVMNPYQGYKIYGPYERKDGRKHVVAVRRFQGLENRITISYPKYLVEMNIGKRLDSDLTVDHEDRNKTNDSLENLRIVPKSQHMKDDAKRVKKLKFKCMMCNKEVERFPSDIRVNYKSDSFGLFCNRSCKGKFWRLVQQGKRDPPSKTFTDEEIVSNHYYLDKNKIPG